MKYIYVIVCSLILFSCSKETSNPKRIIEDFITNVYLQDSVSVEKINEYMTEEFLVKYNSLSEEKKKIHEEYITSYINRVRETLKERKDFRVMNIQELETSNIHFKKLGYQGEGEVYGLVVGNENLLFFIIENNKLHSFCNDIFLSDTNELVPYFFFKRT